MPIISAEPIHAQIYRISYMVCADVIENIIVSPDGLYDIHWIKNGHMENHSGKIINVVQDRANPKNSYLLFDYSCDSSSRRERILFYQIQMLKDITPNDAYQIALKHGFVGSFDDWRASLKGERGYSNYELAVQAGFVGTLQEYLESLKGKSAYDLSVEQGFNGTLEEWYAKNGDTVLFQKQLDNVTAKISWMFTM